MRKIFPVCCASASETAQKSIAPSSKESDFLLHVFFLASCLIALDTRLFSLDHLIRPIQHRLRNRQPDLLGCFQIDHQLKLRRLLHRQIGGLGSLQDSVHVICDAPVAVRLVRPVGHEPTSFYSFSVVVHRR